METGTLNANPHLYPCLASMSLSFSFCFFFVQILFPTTLVIQVTLPCLSLVSSSPE